MAGGFKNFSNQRPCPICGKPDWCGLLPATEGGYLVVCQRDTNKSNTIGNDGNFYVYVADAKDSGSSIYEEANQRRAKTEQYSAGKNFAEYKAPQPKTLTVVDKVDPLSNEKLDVIYRTMLSFLSLEPRHKEYLLSEGWTEELIIQNKVVSFPEKDFTRFKYRKDIKSKNPYRKKLAELVMNKLGLSDLRGVPGAYRDSSGKWTFAGRSGILFPVYDVNHKLYRVRLRLDFRDVDAQVNPGGSKDDWYLLNGEKHYINLKGTYQIIDGEKKYDKAKGKYRNFASYRIDEKEEEKGFLVNSYDSGCESGNQLGFYFNESRDDMYIMYLTEGEKKGIYSNDKLRAPFISSPGVNSWSKLFEGKKGERPVDIIKQRGVKIFVIAYDADKLVNKAVLQAEQNVVKALLEEGFILGLAEWPAEYGKGIDEMLHNGYKMTFAAVNNL